MTPTGQTADGSWEVGVRRTLPLAKAEAWTWALGVVAADPAAAEARSLTAEEVARFPYRLESGDSTLQVRVLTAATGTTIAFHHEGLADADEREQMRQRWTDALEGLGE